jgi:hypothetical protein
MRALAPEGIFLSRARESKGWKKRTSAAKAGYGGVIYGTAEAVPFLQDRFSRRPLGYASSSLAYCCRDDF